LGLPSSRNDSGLDGRAGPALDPASGLLLLLHPEWKRGYLPKELKQLRSFLVVARTLSFSRAAVELHLSQPALSALIMALEADLGVQTWLASRKAIDEKRLSGIDLLICFFDHCSQNIQLDL
jgi:hypothetical protein